MTTYATIPDSDIDPESAGTTTLFTRLRNNPIAITEGAAGAPRILTNGLSDEAVTEAKIGPFAVTETRIGAGAVTESKIGTNAVTEIKLGGSSVSQTKLKSTTASQSVSVGASATNSITLTGGTYTLGWFPGGSSTYIEVIAHGGTYDTKVGFRNTYIDGPNTAYLYSRYIQASPPYDLGDGNVDMFVFVAIDNGTGEILGAYAAEDPPWAYHGPTNIAADYYDKEGRGWRGDIEITQAIKQADMPLFPHPWTVDALVGDYRVVMLNPFGGIFEQFSDTGKIIEALHNGAIKIGAPISGLNTPPEVDIVAWELGDPIPVPIPTAAELLAQARASASLTRREFFLGLDAMGMYDIVMGTELPRYAKIELDTATQFDRTWPTLVEMAATLGVTDEQLDALFGIEVI